MKSRTLILGVLFVPLSAAVAADEPLKPVTIEVIDARTKKAVTEFEYQYLVEFVSQPPRGFRDEGAGKVSSASGSFEILAPASCKLSVDIQSRESLRGYGHNGFAYVIKSDDAVRKFRAELKLGITVRGIVRDAETKRPIVGAKVSPLVQIVPGWQGDEERHVFTGNDGKYELLGVEPNLGVVAEHPDYPQEEEQLLRPRETPVETVVDIELRKPEKPKFLGNLHGLVNDVEGKPLAGVEVSANERETLTAADGSFDLTLEAKKNRPCYICFSKPGFLRAWIDAPQPLPPRLTVLLEPEPRIEGHVRSADGRPVESFRIMAGPGENPHGFECVKETIKDRDGRFSLTLEKPGRTWVGIRAEGLAHWEGHVTLGRKKEVLDVTLTPGCAVIGQVAPRGGAPQDLQAKLIPRRNASDSPHHDDLAVRDLATAEAGIRADGRFQFRDVRPGHYVLRIHGPGVTARQLLFQVPTSGVDLGLISLAGTGRLVGSVHRPPKDGGGVWSFARGNVFSPTLDSHLEPDFTADENGHFTVDGVPAGIVSVGIPVQHYDVITFLSWSARVFEGKTTEVNVLDPRDDRRLAVTLQVGDGSKKQFASGTAIGAARAVDNVNAPSSLFAAFHRQAEKAQKEQHEPRFMLDLRLPEAPTSFEDPDWARLDERGQIALQGVRPGRYHLALVAFPGQRRLGNEPLFETELEMKPGMPPLKVILGGGSITGEFDDSRDAEVFALGNRTGRLFRTWSTWRGGFCSRFLPPDTYTLLLHSAEKGWARVPDIAVYDEVRDVGTIKAITGGTVRGRIIARVPTEIPDAVVAVGPNGIELKMPEFRGADHGEYVFNHLWPGAWTIVLRAGQKVLAQQRVAIEGREAQTIDLTISAPATP